MYSLSADFSKSSIVPPICQIGTLNPEALKLPALRHKSLTATYDHISKLSYDAERLKCENDILRKRLNSLVDNSKNVDPASPFTKIKQREIDFSKKAEEHETELNNFARVINHFRTNHYPTFVEVASNFTNSTPNKKPTFDLITASLLVSNQQKPFFNRDDIEQQNEELKTLITKQEETLRLLHARLNLFREHDRNNTLTLTLNSLKKGETPLILTDSAPSRKSELSIKRRVLSKELRELVKKRKILEKERIKEREKFKQSTLKLREVMNELNEKRASEEEKKANEKKSRNKGRISFNSRPASNKKKNTAENLQKTQLENSEIPENKSHQIPNPENQQIEERENQQE